ncbi:uncharacterized protein PAC_15742 [Phialocephala subalpina]|uniref:Uncharacterized protein n=1 Tax=Phialocephala subalpina TaxID=576137 RepID=A0A1L7XLD0_9HELO|nr:uncharacterized protein PAC_15742 [Phialocephala subalpina]
MASTTQAIQQPGDLAPGRTLQVDFSWKKFKSLITEKDDPNSKPVYIVDYKTFSPHLVFKSGVDNSTFGTGTLHPISINADCDIRGQHITLKAMKRFKTSYMHLSPTFSGTKEPVPLIWTSDCDFKTWDFICMDENQLPVAKFSANIWALMGCGCWMILLGWIARCQVQIYHVVSKLRCPFC